MHLLWRGFFCLSALFPMHILGAVLNRSSEQLFLDLEKVHEIDRKIGDRLPLLLNYQLQGGYFAMPSARTGSGGAFGLGFAHVPPYRLWSLGLQFFDRVELTGNYWIYEGIMDWNFGHLGFGEEAERAANVKFILLRQSDGFPLLPEFAMGWNDFIGTCRFASFYLTATREWLDANVETTLGWGHGRIHGFYGGIGWTPWRHSTAIWKGLSCVAEYDANDYKHHAPEHPSGRTVNHRINAGLQFRLGDWLQASLSSLRGNHWASGLSLHYNLGATRGFFPKIFDSKVYTAPLDLEPLGDRRTEGGFAQEMAYVFKEQGFDLYTLKRVPGLGGKDSLWVKLINARYWKEEEVRCRLEHVAAFLEPENIDSLTMVVECDGLPIHEYRFSQRELMRYRAGRLGEAEFGVVAPLQEVGAIPGIYDATLLYQRTKSSWVLTFRPWMQTFFGSSSGKFKYETGFYLGPEGYLFDQFYYNVQASYTLFASTQTMGDKDILNPSRLINVRTDAIRYHQANSFHIDTAYLQKSWNLGRGWFSRLAAGYFETAYAGFAAEALYFPVGYNWALGGEVATVWKRSYEGLGFQKKIRRLTDAGYDYFPFTGFQYFLDFYYDYKPYGLDCKITVGQFLARDKGIRCEGGRIFASGLRLGIWYALTNGNDVVNEKRYYDKGFSITLPLDLFMNQSSRTRVGYSMAAWLRDIDARAATGKMLYPTIYWERYTP